MRDEIFIDGELVVRKGDFLAADHVLRIMILSAHSQNKCFASELANGLKVAVRFRKR